MKTVAIIYPDYKVENLPIPLAPLYLAAWLQKFGYDVKILDTRVLDYDASFFNGVGVVGISAMTGSQIKFGLEIAKKIKKDFKDIPLVWGGIHLSLLPEQAIENEFVDYVVTGEGEQTFYELVEHIFSDKNVSDIASIKGLVYQDENGQIKRNSEREFISLDEIPLVPYDLLKQTKCYHVDKQIAYQSSRGCPYNCSFCYNQTVNHKRWRGKSPEIVIRDLKYLKKTFNVSSVNFVDDQALVKKTRTLKIAELFIKEELNINWSASVTVNSFHNYTDDEVKLLKKSGLKALAFGAESGSERILHLLHKDTHVQKFYEVARKCQRQKLGATFYFMMGFPWETEEDVEKTFRVIDILSKIGSLVYLKGIMRLTPYPGTECFDIAREQGCEFPQNFEEWDEYGHTTNVQLPWLDEKTQKKYDLISLIARNGGLNQWNFKSINGHYTSYKFFFYHLDARIRWKLRFFLFAPEWKLYTWIMRRFHGKSNF